MIKQIWADELSWITAAIISYMLAMAAQHM